MPINALLLLLGMALVQQCSHLEIAWLWLSAGVALVLAWRGYWRLFVFAFAMVWAMAFAQWRLAQQLTTDLEGVILPIEGIISNLPEQDAHHARFEFSITQAPQGVPQKLRLSAYSVKQTLKAGQHWAFSVKLKRPHSTFNPDGFDYERWLFEQNIGATGSVRNSPPPVFIDDQPFTVLFTVLRQQLSEQITQVLGDTPSSALLKALTLGDSRAMSQAQWQVLRNTGTTHLLVISGSHIGLIAGLVFLLARHCWARTGVLRYSPQVIAAWLALVSGIFYALLAGFAIPIQRASVMLACAMFAVILQRNTRPLQVLSLSGCAVLLYDPLAVLSIGSCLSFASVGLIIYAVSARLQPPAAWFAALKIHCFAFVGLAPPLLWFFSQLSLWSPFANVIAVPVISILIVPLALAALPLLFIVPALAKILLLIADISMQGLWWFLEQCTTTPLSHALPEPWLLVLMIIAVLLLLAPRGMPARGLALVLLLPIAFTKTNAPANGELRLTLLDVGQGLAVVMQTAEHWLIYDTGGKFSSEHDSGTMVLLPFLQARGVSQLDTVIISHGDNDHIGGAESLLTALPTNKLLTSVPSALPSFNPQACYAGQSWHYDGVFFKVLSPPQLNQLSSENDNSCVLQIKTAHDTILLTGDIEAKAEADLVNRYGSALQAEVLIAPHHGSKTSSTLAFLQTVKPKTVLIPAGYRNSFGHPHASVLARYQSLGVRYFNNADNGAINLQTNAEQGLSIETTRQSLGHYWNAH